MIKKILIFTGSRGEWGYLRPVISELEKNNLNYKIVVSNMHTSLSHGETYKEIEKDGFSVSHKIYMNLDGPEELVWSKSLGLLQFQLSDILFNYKPDMLLIAGDRAETFIASITAFYSDILIGHIQAGERSGHKDGMVRHAIGKLAHVHFASNNDAEMRLINFGEQQFRIHNTGAPQLDDMVHSLPINPQGLAKKIIEKNTPFAICVVHPTSENSADCEGYIDLIYHELQARNITQIWILPNNDSGSRKIYEKIIDLPLGNLYKFRNLSRGEYLSLLKESKFIIGNSSSGILEASTFQIPTINLGERQKDRVSSESVIHIEKPNRKNIAKSLSLVDTENFEKTLKDVKNPYGDGNSAKRIVEIIKSLEVSSSYLRNKIVTK